MNLLEETLEILQKYNKKETDVCWVGTTEVKTTWEDFKKYANVHYDSGIGVLEASIPHNLIIVGKDWWLERTKSESDFEQWLFKTIPKEPISTITLKALTVDQAIELGVNVEHFSIKTLELLNSF